MEESKDFDVGPQAQASFQEVVKIEPCSANECPNGHKWPPQFALQQCPGCGGTIVLVRMINCPVCNEPPAKVRFRTDHTAQGFGVAALCRGQKGMAESNQVEMIRHAHEEVMNNWDEKSGRFQLP